MAIYTSYFAKYRGENAVSIAAFSPNGFRGKVYKPLAPPQWLLWQFKNLGNEVEYERLYRLHVLDKLEPHQVLSDLGDAAVLLCWEKSGRFCHRYIVADWFYEQLGLVVEEL